MSGTNLFRARVTENSIFLDERYLYPEFIPEVLPGRGKEIESLVYCFDPLLKGKKPVNVFLSGSTGVGKTVCVKFVLKELEDASDRAKSLYLNCFEFNSRAAILIALANFLGSAVPRRGLATDEIYTSVLESMRKCSFTPIVVLDEVDQLLASDSGSKLLYDLLRVVEHGKQGIGIVLISNDVELTSRLDSRIRSSLAEQTVVFSPYTPEQLKKILSERSELAFVKGVVDKDAIGVAAAHAAKLGGDARIAIESLLKAGRIAEKENSGKLLVAHLKGAFESVDAASLAKGLGFLARDELLLLKIISENPAINSGAIYGLYSKEKGASLKERRLRDVLAALEKQNFISSEPVSMGNQGKTRQFRCGIPKELILKGL
ncbi:MAG: AAA family ATPase [archaeon]